LFDEIFVQYWGKPRQAESEGQLKDGRVKEVKRTSDVDFVAVCAKAH
jgi:hypothetical protein